MTQDDQVQQTMLERYLIGVLGIKDTITTLIIGTYEEGIMHESYYMLYYEFY